MKRSFIFAVLLMSLVSALPGTLSASPKPVQKVIYITLDGGPSQDFSDIVLPIMAKHNCRVTWFVVGEHIMRDVYAARQLVTAGHEVEIHTWTHKDLTKLNNDDALLQVEWAAALIRQWTDQEPLFVRPPYGAHNQRIDGIIKELGYQVAMWDAEYPDYAPGTPAKLVESIAGQARPNAIVLLHVTRLTWQALPALLERLDKMGYTYGLMREHPKFAPPAAKEPKG